MRRTLIRIVAVALLLYSLWSLASVRRVLYQAQARLPELEEQLSALRQEGSLLLGQLEQGADDEFIRSLAQERLGLVNSGDIIFYFR